MPLLSCLHTLRMRMLVVVFAGWIFSLHLMPNSLLSPPALAQNILGFTEQVSPNAQSNATEPSVAVDRSDGTVYVAWQASGTHVTRSDDGGHTFGSAVDVLGTDMIAFANSFCNTVPSGIEVDPETGEVYVQWITADPVQNTSQGCNISQIEPFRQVWVAHSPPAVGMSLAQVTT